ncbi:chaperone [Lithospermum erythrorhizon]|uniref:Peptidyl-prolyl cis-trans isomerase n=1 Tax=Lithospermum erythrorhizon TaxID=34254 RepID=A0AAV3RIM1_LITER
MARIKPQTLVQQSKKKKLATPTTLVLYTLIVIVMVFFLLASYRHWSRRSIIPTDDSLSIVKDAKASFNSKKLEIPRYAIINTSKGFITVELYKEGSSSEVVADFINFCQKGHFKGMLFNRVIKNFVIQGGDVEGGDETEDWTTRGKHYSQLDTSLKHEAFMLGTSKGKDENAGFDLFITTAPIPDLNEKINVFGRVIKGEDVVQVYFLFLKSVQHMFASRLKEETGNNIF